MDVSAFTNNLRSFSMHKFYSHRIFCERVLDFQPGERGVISNGKVSILILHGVTVNTKFFYDISFVVHLGYWHQRADERHGNPSPR